ncbi:MAG: DEAD/DEAH box helicase [Pseudohongiellaceae bacterium]
MALTHFHPAARDWFNSQFGEPTETQVQAWPAIKSGRHTLISAPTGSGKTLAAFYAAIDDLLQKGLQRQLHPGVQILYVSPLKALSNDIHKNLEIPLKGIAENLKRSGKVAADITIAVRTGDTPASERQKMAKKPPHILVTTPESFYLLLTSASGRAMLANVSTLIVDEIHAMLGDKRGSHLALSIERLQRLVLKNSGQRLQRIGLSATQRPIEMVAKYLVGNSNYTKNTIDCEIVDAGSHRFMDVRLEVPASPLTALMSNEVWEELYKRLVELITTHQTTLVFVNTRRLSERLALALSERLGEDAVCSHHGSMSKELRHDAEQRLKAGQLKVLVATASMELGIDIGSVDLVVQFSSPKSIATFLQRVGRSGHSIHGTPKGILFPLTRDDLVESAALLHSIREGQLDCIVMPQKPLDILSQQIVAEVSSQLHDEAGQTGGLFDQQQAGWNVDELYSLFHNAYSYRNLDREEFDTTVQMLADGYSSRRGRRGTHLHLDAINNRLRARRGANLIALTNGGAIPDMFDYQVVLDPEDIVVGSLNEDFALEALPGDIFTLGTHSWQMLRVDGLKVRVRDAQGMQPTIPFWFGEGIGRTRELSEAVSNLRQTIADLLINDSANAALQWLVDNAGLPRAGAMQLVEYLEAGMNALGVMPTRTSIVMERFFDEVGDMHVVIHSPFGSRINRGWGLALRKRFCKSFNFELQAAANEDSIVISLGSIHSFPLDDVFKFLQSATIRDVLVQALLDAPMFEVRWRWNATRSLAIQRNRNGKRVPPQFQRMDAEDLIAHVFPDQIACAENLTGRRDVPEHPLVNQTIHDCLTEAMDIEELTELIADIEENRLTLTAKDLTEPSPFAQEIINARPYAFLDDAPFEERRSNAIRNRSWADPGEAKDFSLLDIQAIARVKEEAWPYINNVEEMHDGLCSLAYMSKAEFEKEPNYRHWHQLLLEAGRCLHLSELSNELWIATEKLGYFIAVYPQLQALTESHHIPQFILEQQWDRKDALREIVRARLECLGPIRAVQLAAELAINVAEIDMALLALEVEGFAFQGQFTAQARKDQAAAEPPVEWCERRLLQRIHRYTIDAHRKSIKPVSLQSYTEFLFDTHQLVQVSEPTLGSSTAREPVLDGQTRLQNSLGKLDGIAAPAASWEADLLPTRVADYDPNWLDILCISGKLVWGRYTVPNTALRTKRLQSSPVSNVARPIKSTPISIVSRNNLDIFKALAAAQYGEAETPPRSELAQQIEADLERSGASFFDQIQQRTGLLRAQLELGLAELVSTARITSDSFTGLRALLTPNKKKPSSHTSKRSRRGRRAMFGVEDAGRWSLLETDISKPQQGSNSRHWEVLDEEQMERLIGIYLQRWGVLFRGLLERELFAPPWRVLLAALRKLELRGTIRGGRFVAGVGGEQFAFPETVDALRKFNKTKDDVRLKYHSLSAVDPLNLLNLIMPNRKLSRLSKNRVLYENGVPIAILESAQVRFLKEVDPAQEWSLQQALIKKNFPPRLRSYLGSR